MAFCRAISPAISRSRPPATAAIANIRARKCAASMATSAIAAIRSEVHFTLGLAQNRFGGRGPAPVDLVNNDTSAIYTTPQTNKNSLSQYDFNAAFTPAPNWKILTDLHYRAFDQAHVDGNTTDLNSCGAADAVRRQRQFDLSARYFPGRGQSRRHRPHLDALAHGGRHGSDREHRQDLLNAQQVHFRRELRTWLDQFLRRRGSRRAEPRRSLDHRPWHVEHRPDRRRADRPSQRRQQLPRRLRSRCAGCHRQAHRHRRRALQLCGDQPLRSRGNLAQRQRRVHPFQPDDRRELQAHAGSHRLRELLRGQSRADAVGAWLRQSEPALPHRQFSRLRSAAQASGFAFDRDGPARRDALAATAAGTLRLERRRLSHDELQRHLKRAERRHGPWLFHQRRHHAAPGDRDLDTLQGRKAHHLHQLHADRRDLPLASPAGIAE